MADHETEDPAPCASSETSAGVVELDSRCLNIQSKKFHLDVKQNSAGRFLKVAELNMSGNKNKIIFDMKSAKNLLDVLTDFVELYATMGPQERNSKSRRSMPIKSASFKRIPYDRIYHVDFGENDKGKYLKLTCASPNMQRMKQAVVFPAQGMVDFRDTLKELLQRYYVDESEPELPESRRLRVDNKMIFMDIFHNNRGYYLKLSEVPRNQNVGNYRRQSITFPRRFWTRLRDSIDEFINELNDPDEPYVESGEEDSSTMSKSHLPDEEEDSNENPADFEE